MRKLCAKIMIPGDGHEQNKPADVIINYDEWKKTGQAPEPGIIHGSVKIFMKIGEAGMKPPSMESFECRCRALFCFIQKHVIPEGLIGNLVF